MQNQRAQPRGPIDLKGEYERDRDSKKHSRFSLIPRLSTGCAQGNYLR